MADMNELDELEISRLQLFQDFFSEVRKLDIFGFNFLAKLLPLVALTEIDQTYPFFFPALP